MKPCALPPLTAPCPHYPRPSCLCPTGLPLPYAYEPLLCEVLFGQMLRLPRPQFKPLMYSTLMVDLCKLRHLFPRAMSACVRCGHLVEWQACLRYHQALPLSRPHSLPSSPPLFHPSPANIPPGPLSSSLQTPVLLPAQISAGP